jgi:excinuclease ABC subunit B
MDVSLEDAKNLPANDGVTATVKALEDLIENGHPAVPEGTWTPHRPERPVKSEGGIPFKLVSAYEPKGDQPTAIADLVEGIERPATRRRCCSASPARARPSPWRR